MSQRTSGRKGEKPGAETGVKGCPGSRWWDAPGGGEGAVVHNVSVQMHHRAPQGPQVGGEDEFSLTSRTLWVRLTLSNDIFKSEKIVEMY